MSFAVDDLIEEQSIDEAVVLSLPRLMNVALSHPESSSPLFDELVADIAAIDEALAAPYLAALADARFHHLRHTRGVDPSDPPSMLGVVAALDGLTKRPQDATDLQNILFLVFGDPADKGTCGRLATACRSAMGRVSPRSIAAELAARHGMGPISDWRRIPIMAAKHVSLSMQREAAAAAGEPIPALDDTLARAAQINSWQEAAVGVIHSCRELIVGLSCMAAGEVAQGYNLALVEHARRIGGNVLADTTRAAEERIVARYERVAQREAAAAEAKASEDAKAATESEPEIAAGHVLVCPVLPLVGRAAEAYASYKRAIGKPLPLVPLPNVDAVGSTLTMEFPHFADATAQIVRELTGRAYVGIRPLMFVGKPGSGKSRYARRLGEELGVGILRVDGAGDAGVSFAGTERRWYSTEPCRPFMACARHSQANPFVLVDEIDKAPTRTEYGRLWDGMLAFMETETAARFQDPCLQAEIDVSRVSMLATANEVGRLPPPLLDRFGIVLVMPDPGLEHLPALAASIARDLATRQRLDPRFVEPFDEIELDAMRRFWRGGSLRALGRLVAAALRARDAAPRNFH